MTILTIIFIVGLFALLWDITRNVRAIGMLIEDNNEIIKEMKKKIKEIK